MKFSIVRKLFSDFFFQDQDQDHDQDQDFTMKFINTSYALYTKDTHQIWCRSVMFSWKSKFCSGWGWGSGSWFYFGFRYQSYISYIADSQTDRRNFFCLFSLLRRIKHEHSSKGEHFFSIMRLQYFLFLHTRYVMRRKKAQKCWKRCARGDITHGIDTIISSSRLPNDFPDETFPHSLVASCTKVFQRWNGRRERQRKEDPSYRIPILYCSISILYSKLYVSFSCLFL